MKYLSVCSGIEAVSVAWQPLGWQPAMFAEIDPFCCWLLRSRYRASRPVHMPSPHDASSRKEAKQRAAAIRNIVALPAEGAVINAGDFTKIGADDVEVMQSLGTNANATGRNAPSVAFTLHGSDGTASAASSTDIAGSLRTRAPGGIENSSTTAVLQEHSVAWSGELTASTDIAGTLQQGFPDDYTLVEYRGKPAADGPRYKALGNSMAVLVMRWIGERIAAVDAILRDGSGTGSVS
jgi:site-specific DNA-cytosine methylase